MWRINDIWAEPCAGSDHRRETSLRPIWGRQKSELSWETGVIIRGGLRHCPIAGRTAAVRYAAAVWRPPCELLYPCRCFGRRIHG